MAAGLIGARRSEGRAVSICTPNGRHSNRRKSQFAFQPVLFSSSSTPVAGASAEILMAGTEPASVGSQ